MDNYFDRVSEIYVFLNKILPFKIAEYLILKRIILFLSRKYHNAIFLDIGCGNAYYFKDFPKRILVVGVDKSGKMLKIAKSKNINKVFVMADGCNLPFKKNMFDCVMVIGSLEFMDCKIKKFFDATTNLMKRKSYLLLLVPSNNIFGFLYKIFHRVISKTYIDLNLGRESQEVFEKNGFIKILECNLGISKFFVYRF